MDSGGDGAGDDAELKALAADKVHDLYRDIVNKAYEVALARVKAAKP